MKSAAGLQALNDALAEKSYIEGFMPKSSDVSTFSQLSGAPKSHPHALRWYNHIASFSAQEKAAFPAGCTTAQAAPQQKQAKKEDSDDDMFGDDDDDEDDEEETPAEKAKREKMEKMKADAAKPKKVVIAKSEVTLDVKPWDDETDMKELERLVRTIAMEGLIWSAGKLEPVGYGIYKLRIRCVVVDDLVSTEDIEDKIKAFEDHVQSVDIFAFNKI